MKCYIIFFQSERTPEKIAADALKRKEARTPEKIAAETLKRKEARVKFNYLSLYGRSNNYEKNLNLSYLLQNQVKVYSFTSVL